MVPAVGVEQIADPRDGASMRGTILFMNHQYWI